MCIPYNGACNGWNHPFAGTLHVGDLLVLQGVSPRDLKADYPNSDIIVFHEPGDPNDLIVHRIVSVEEVDGKLIFRTKGDGNSLTKYPNTPQTAEYDPWPIPQDQVVGKVILRIPWLGHVVLFMRTPSGLVLVAVLVVMLLVIEFIVPIFRKKQTEPEPKGSESEAL
jgi:signal peptidase